MFNQAGLAHAAALATARARLTAFFAAGGGYLGTGTNGAAFLTAAGEVPGLTAATRSGAGRSGIVLWDNTGGPSSPITGAYPARDTAIMDPPTWLTAVPSTLGRGRAAAGLGVLRGRSVAARRAVGERAGRRADRARAERDEHEPGSPCSP